MTHQEIAQTINLHNIILDSLESKLMSRLEKNHELDVRDQHKIEELRNLARTEADEMFSPLENS